MISSMSSLANGSKNNRKKCVPQKLAALLVYIIICMQNLTLANKHLYQQVLPTFGLPILLLTAAYPYQLWQSRYTRESICLIYCITNSVAALAVRAQLLAFSTMYSTPEDVRQHHVCRHCGILINVQQRC